MGLLSGGRPTPSFLPEWNPMIQPIFNCALGFSTTRFSTWLPPEGPTGFGPCSRIVSGCSRNFASRQKSIKITKPWTQLSSSKSYLFMACLGGIHLPQSISADLLFQSVSLNSQALLYPFKVPMSALAPWTFCILVCASSDGVRGRVTIFQVPKRRTLLGEGSAGGGIWRVVEECVCTGKGTWACGRE